MRRRTFDAIVASMGLVIAGVLVVAGGLLVWGHSFVTSQVHNQLAAQKIFFPAKGDAAIKELPKADATAMTKNAGLQMTTGAQAETYADHFIAVHLVKIGGGQTYSQLSGKALANPKDTALAAQVQTIFRGETLRGLLLNAYGYWEMGQIMLWSAFIAFAAGALMLLLSLFGYAHLRRTAPEAEILPKIATRPRVQTA
jgi:hypothetical protein